MFLRQNFIFCRLCLRGSGGSGVLSGVAADLLTVCEFSSGWDGYILRSRAFQREKQGFKKMLPYTISSHFYLRSQGLIKGWFREIFGGYEPTRGLQGLYITLFSVVFWSGWALASFQACFRRVIRPRLLSCGRWWALSPSDSVKLREGRLYIHILLFSVFWA